MLIGLMLVLGVVGSGHGVLRLLRLWKGYESIGLAAPVGLATLVVATGWPALLGAPPLLGTVLAGAISGCGWLLIARDWRSAVLWCRAQPLASGLLGVAVATPLLISAFSVFGQAEVPLYTPDGAHHVETVEDLRHGVRSAALAWYPPGFHAMVAALLGPVPWIDSAAGTMGASLGLAPLVPLGLFGLGCGLLRRPLTAAVGAVLGAFTLQFPYLAFYFSIWPMVAGLILTMGLWTATLEYLARPSPRQVVLVALLLASIVLTHGTELYTAAIGLAILTVFWWRWIAWRRLPRDVALAVSLALALAAPYLPIVLGWARSGGAAAAAEVQYPSLPQAPLGSLLGEAHFWSNLVTAGLVLDAVPRIVFLLVGIWWAARHRHGRALLALFMVFLGLTVLFRFGSGPMFQKLFALTFPWGVYYRLAMVPALVSALLGAAGLVASVSAYRAWRSGGEAPRAETARWRMPRLGLVLATLSIQVSIVLMAQLVSAGVERYLTYSADDAAAMAWLRAHAEPGALVANDATADAGIWVPYKAGLPILLPRRVADQLGTRSLVRQHVAELSSSPELTAAACELGVKYVYHGAAGTQEEQRSFPSLDVLRASPDLEEVFASGEAVVFRAHLDCSATAPPTDLLTNT